MEGHTSRRDNHSLPHIASTIRGISSNRFVLTVYSEGHFSRTANRLLLHIASSIRGISQKLVVTLCKLKGIFLGEEIGFCSISRLL